MKQVFPLLLLCFFTGNLVAQTNLPNSGFENWTGIEPDDWETNNVTGVAIPLTKSTDAHSGTSAIRGEIILASGVAFAPSLGTQNGYPFPFTQKHAFFNFYYKMHRASAGDGLIISLTAYDAQSNLVGIVNYKLSDETSTYKLAQIPITYLGNNPVDCYLVLTLQDTSGTAGTIGSYYLLDDVTFSGTVSVDDVNADSPYFNIATQTSAGNWLVRADDFWMGANLQITGIDGRELYRTVVEADGQPLATELPAGMYIVTVQKQGKTAVKKVMKQ